MSNALVLDISQERAVRLVCSARCGIVTGGPGTGKTTCLKTALDRLDAQGVRYELCAPTGKAAKRMNETTGRPARTIHRLLEFHPKFGFRRGETAPLDTDVVIVDESSMVDIELAAALLAALGRARLILIGDADQLPPVGPGRPFGDLVDSGEVPTVRLQYQHRAGTESWIHVNAPRLLEGEMPALERRHDFVFVETPTAAEIMPMLVKLVTRYVPKKIDAVTQVLIPQHGGVAGIEAANRALQQALNPRDDDAPYLPRKDYEIRLGDRVIQCQNDYDLEVFNGELGDVVDVDNRQVVVRLEGRGEVSYTLDQARGLQLAYALTVHRSQGSEFPWVIVVVHSTHSFILNAQLVYTAITRARQGVILVGDRKGLRHALRASRQPKRHTTLIERLRGELEDAHSYD
jgi:exodeoxyribonuclease V alpha subunit